MCFRCFVRYLGNKPSESELSLLFFDTDWGKLPEDKQFWLLHLLEHERNLTALK